MVMGQQLNAMQRLKLKVNIQHYMIKLKILFMSVDLLEQVMF